VGPIGEVKIYYDRTGNTLTVWFDQPRGESFCEEFGDDAMLINDDRGRILGVERLNHLSHSQRDREADFPIEPRMPGD
jgi:hypothetical protein